MRRLQTVLGLISPTSPPHVSGNFLPFLLIGISNLTFFPIPIHRSVSIHCALKSKSEAIDFVATPIPSICVCCNFRLKLKNQPWIEMASSLEAAGEPIPTSAVLMSASKHIAVRCRGVIV
ncbi:hypothetical protein HanIR_Chr02g0082051 [Helianthus annuus]|nr:hypothetical protein HanIR_Chr02g0082051 [Helianthus annuus]